MYLSLIITLNFLTLACAQVCCNGRCYATDGDFSHLPKPSCVDVQFGLFTRENPKTATVLTSGSALPADFKADRRVAFIIHGYHNSWDSSYMQVIRDNLLIREDMTVLLVDWKNGANNLYYPQSASNTRAVGGEVATLMDRFVSQMGLLRKNLWCVGFSLGAHTCGFAGKLTEMERITGLDPAGPYFANHENARLDKSCANFVDVIHTDGDDMMIYYGLMVPSGHADYYPNEGKNQPGCFTSATYVPDFNMTLPYMDVAWSGTWSMSCSHGKAAMFFIESIRDDYCFVARQICTDENNLPRSCSFNEFAVMGYGADEDPRHGIFYLETRSRDPHCLY